MNKEKNMSENREEKTVETKEETKETKKQEQSVTNEMLLKHLQNIEIALANITNGFTAIFDLITSRAEQLKLDEEEKAMLIGGIESYINQTHFLEVESGMKKRLDKELKDLPPHIKAIIGILGL